MKRPIGISVLLVMALSVSSGISAARAAVPDAAAVGGTIAFSHGDQFPGGDLFAPSDVFTVHPDGTNLRQLTHAPAGTNAALPSVSADGTKIVYEVGNTVGTYEIWTMDVDGGNQTQITNEPGFLHLTPSWSPDGHKIVFSRCDLPFGFVSSCDIAIINADGSHLHRVVGGNVVHSRPEFSPDGRQIVFGSDRSGDLAAVWVVNADGSHLRRVTAAGTEGFWPDWSADGSRVLFTDNCCRPHSSLWSMRPDGSDTHRLTNAAPGHDSSFGSFAPSGRDVVFVNNDAYSDFCCSDLRIRRADGTVSTVLNGLDGLVLASWGPTPAASAQASPAVQSAATSTSISTSAAARVVDAKSQTEPADGSAAPPSGRILFTDFNTGQIYGVRSDGSGLTQLTHNDANHFSVNAQAAPGGRIVFSQLVNAADDEGRIWIMDADGTNAHQLATDTAGYRDSSPNVTPDGKHIVFVRCQPDDGVCAIWIMHFDGTHMRALTPFRLEPNEAIDFAPTLSRDGKYVAFERFDWRGITIQTYVMGIDGRNEHPVTAPAVEAGLPDFAPDGGLTVSSRAVRLGDSVYSMHADGSHLAQLTRDRYPNSSFGSVYSPNGNQIAFSSDRNYADGCCVDLFVMNADGSHETQVPIGALHGVSQIAWVPSPPATAAAAPAAIPAATLQASAARSPRSWCRGRYPSGLRRWWVQSARSGSTICATRSS